MDSFTQKVLLTILDKGVLALGALGIGYWISKRLETFKAGQQRVSELERENIALENELYKQRQTSRHQFKERQLSLFYWPIFFRLMKDSAMWKAIPQLSDGPKSLPSHLARDVELSFLIKNHEELVSTIENNIYLAEADERMLAAIIAYVKHVAVYKALRAAKDYDRNPIDLGEPFPAELIEIIETRLNSLQEEYDRLLRPTP